jgi:hypothetical protein
MIFYVDPRGDNITNSILPLLRDRRLFPALQSEEIITSKLDFVMHGAYDSGACIVESVRQLVEQGGLDNLKMVDMASFKQDHMHSLLKLNTITFLLCWNRFRKENSHKTEKLLTTTLGDLSLDIIMEILFYTGNIIKYQGNNIRYRY